MTYPFLYWVTYYDEFKDGSEAISGCTFATTFYEAAENIENYYGNTLYSLKLEPLEDSLILEFSTYDEAEKILKGE